MTGSETVVPPDALLEDRCEWARMHGLDPDVIPLDYPIEIDYDARRIVYHRFVLDQGQEVWVSTGDDEWLLMVRVVHQLESPPRPFPSRRAA